MKTKLILNGILALTTLYTLKAQNSSSNVNGASINGVDCAAYGFNALPSNLLGGTNNTALGCRALFSNTTGDNNTAAGMNAMDFSTGSDNIGIGHDASRIMTTGGRNTGIGDRALVNNQTGALNCGVGTRAGDLNSSGGSNTAFGHETNYLDMQTFQTAVGALATTYQGNMIMLGDANLLSLESYVNYVSTSDGRYKYNIKEEVKGLDFIEKLRPVVYNLETKESVKYITKDFPEEKKAQYVNRDFSNSTNIRRSGFIAQEVERAALTCGYDFDGVNVPENNNAPYSLAYDQFVVPLVKTIQEQQTHLKQLKQQLEDQKAKALENNRPGLSTFQIDFVQGLDIQKTGATNNAVLIRITNESAEKNIALIIYDLKGKELYKLKVKTQVEDVSISKKDLGEGIFLFSVVSDKGLAGSKMLLVE